MQFSEFKSRVTAFLELHPRKKLEKNNAGLLLLAFAIAFFLWVYIASSISSDYSASFNGIPVRIELAGTEAERYNLSLISVEGEEPDTDIRVDCTISGSRTAIGGMNRDDVEIYADFSNVQDNIGAQVLPIKLRTTNGAVISEYTLSKSSLTVTMDRFETHTFPVKEVRYPNLTYDDETIINTDDIVIEPYEVPIHGPSSQLSNIDHVCLTIDDTEELVQTKTFTNCTSYELVDKNGGAVSPTAFNVQVASFSVRIPVTYNRTLPVTVDISNVPAGFDPTFVLQRLRLMTQNQQDVKYELAGYGGNNLCINIETSDPEKKAQLDALESWTIGSVTLSSISVDMMTEIPVEMETGFLDRSQFGTIFLTLDSTDLVADRRWIKNSDIMLMNGNSKYNYVMQSPAGNTAITLIGTREALAEIDSADLRAAVNLINLSVTQEGTFSQAFTVTLPESAKTVWVSPQPKVNITVTLAG